MQWLPMLSKESNWDSMPTSGIVTKAHPRSPPQSMRRLSSGPRPILETCKSCMRAHEIKEPRFPCTFYKTAELPSGHRVREKTPQTMWYKLREYLRACHPGELLCSPDDFFRWEPILTKREASPLSTTAHFLV